MKNFYVIIFLMLIPNSLLFCQGKFLKEKDSISFVNQSISDYCLQGKLDASLYYKGKNSGGAWTLGLSIFPGPVFSIVPAIICSSTEPREKNLNFPNPNLMENPYYKACYIEQAHKIKKRKIWNGFAIGTISISVLYLVSSQITAATSE